MLCPPNSPRYLLMLAVIAFVSGCLIEPATATNARLRALSGSDFLEDDQNVQRWYGSLADYPNLVVLEAGEFTLAEGWRNPAGRQISGPSLGLHVNLDQAGHWGTAAIFLDSYQNDLHPGSLVRDSMKSSLSAMWSRRFGSLQPAFVIRQAWESGDENWSRSRTDYGFGLRIDLSDKAYLDLATELISYREQNGAVEEVSRDNYGFRARAFVQLSEKMALVPVLDYLHEDRPQPAFVEQWPQRMNGHVAKAGLGLNWFKDPDHLLLLAADYSSGLEYYGEPALTDLSLGQTKSQDWRSASITFGFEARYAYWFTLRMSSVFRLLERMPLVGDDLSSYALNFNVGTAIQLADFDFDLSISDSQPRSFAQTPFSPIETYDEYWFTFSLRKRW